LTQSWPERSQPYFSSCQRTNRELEKPDESGAKLVSNMLSGRLLRTIKRHLIDKVPVSDLCDELDIYPNQVYGWLKEFFENGHAAFDNGRKSKAVEDAQQAKIQQLEAKLVRKNEVMAELMEALTEEKKRNGEL